MNDALDDRLNDLGDRLQQRAATSTDDVHDVLRRRARFDRRNRIVGAAGAVLALAVVAAAVVNASGNDRDSQGLNLGNSVPERSEPAPTAAPGPGPSVPGATPEPGGEPATTTTTVVPPTSRPATPPTVTPAFRYQPLFPFASEQEALAWQNGAGAEGHQPWHLSPEQTATAFTGFLGFTDVNQTFETTYLRAGASAQVTVGFADPNGQPVRVAVVHLIRYGTGDGAPWEVVGTEDVLGLTIDTPAYGSVVPSAPEVGGRITGVDESIRVRAYRPGAQGPVGDTPGVPAGGTASRWSSSVTFPPGPGTVIIVASTGGHLAEVERFVVTGVQATGR